MIENEPQLTPQAIDSAEEFIRLSKDRDRESRYKIRCHFLALEQDPSCALGPDLNNFYSILAPNFSKWLLEEPDGRPFDDKAKKFIRDGQEVLRILRVEPSEFSSKVESIVEGVGGVYPFSLSEGHPLKALFDEVEQLCIQGYKAMRARGYTHDELYG